MTGPRLLVVDDDDIVGFAVADYFRHRGVAVTLVTTCGAARDAIAGAPFDLAVIDHRLPDGDGVQLVRDLRELAPQLGIVMVTGAGSIDLAVRAMREGAQNFLTKPVELPALALLLDRIDSERRDARIAASSRSRRERIDQRAVPQIPRAVRALAERAAGTSAPVLLLGETGTGKGLLARWLHAQGPNSKEALVDLNCAGLSRELVESELFGHERGAFTGASVPKCGLFEIAHRGTLFLDELADLDLVVQAKLLKVIEDQRFRRLGATIDRQVSVRLIGATSKDLEGMIARGEFRADLYYRLAGLVIDMPPLRERLDELPIVVEQVLATLSERRQLTDAALELLARHDWPGNIRELRNVLERACLFATGEMLDSDALAPHLRTVRRSATMMVAAPRGDATPTPALSPTGARLTLADVERAHIERTLTEAGGRVDVAAEWLGIPRSTLYERLRRLGLSRR